MYLCNSISDLHSIIVAEEAVCVLIIASSLIMTVSQYFDFTLMNPPAATVAAAPDNDEHDAIL